MRSKIYKVLSISFFGLIFITSFLFLFKKFIFPEQLSLIFSPKEGSIFVKGIVEIGNYKVLRKDIDNKIAFEKCLNRSLDEPMVIGSFIQWGFWENLRIPLKVSVTNSELQEQWESLKKNKSNSSLKISDQALGCLNKLSASQEASFFKVAIKPAILEEKINKAFSLSKKFQKEKLDKATAILEKIKQDPENFDKNAKNIVKQEKGVYYNEIRSALVKNQDLASTSLNMLFARKITGAVNRPLPAGSPFYTNVISTLGEGQIYKDLYETDGTYEIIKLVKKENESFTYQRLVISKESFYNWMQNYIKSNNIKIRISDKNICEQEKNLYKDAWFKDLIICR